MNYMFVFQPFPPPPEGEKEKCLPPEGDQEGGKRNMNNFKP